MGAGHCDNMVTLNFSISNLQNKPIHQQSDHPGPLPSSDWFKPDSTHLTNDVSVGEPHDEAVFGSVVLVLVLRHETFPGEIVRLALWE